MLRQTILGSILVALIAVPTAQAGAELPGTLVLQPERLLNAKERIQAGDPSIMDEYDDLIYAANTQLNTGPWSVMDKEVIPPSGDKHDFMTLGAYFWPNDWSPDGIPWVYRDGYANPDAQLDLAAFWDMTLAAYRLSLAYYFSDHEPYGERAAYLIRYWFLGKETYMTPQFEYAQIIPGVDEDGAAGLVTTGLLMSYLYDSIGLIEHSPAWTTADEDGMQAWSQGYLEWLQTSEKVAVERKYDNNHGIHHDLHPALAYLAIGDIQGARDFLETVGPNRVAVQFEPDGTLPAEINRADSLLYHLVVVRAMAFLAEMGANNGVDIWNYSTEDGRSMRKTVDLLVPYMTGEEEWPYFVGEPFEPAWHVGKTVYRRCALGYWDAGYADVVSRIPGATWWQVQAAGYPFPAPEPADRDDNWVVDFADIVALLGQWGPCEGVGCDLDGDMVITFGDLVILLSRWGRIPG